MNEARASLRFISRRFNSPRLMPRSVKAMRTVSAIGIAIAVAALVIAISIGRGFEKVYTRALLNFNSHVIVMGAGELNSPAETLAGLRAISSKEGILAETVFLYREALLIGGGGIHGTVVKGIDPATLRDVSNMRIELFDSGRTLGDEFKSSKVGDVPVIVGAAMAKTMGLGKDNSTLRMMVPRPDAAKSSREFVNLRTIGTFESGMHDYDAQFVLMSLPDVRKLFGAGRDTVTGIELKLNDPARAREVAANIEREMGPVVKAISWDELNSDLLSAVRLEKFVSSLIMGIMVVVAAINIIATLVLTTIYRMHEIAILKSIGLSNKNVAKIFISGGMRVGFMGICAGLILGLSIAVAVKNLHLIHLEPEIYLVNSLPIDISGPICGLLALVCAAIIFVTSRIAARRLSIVTPAEGLAQTR
jgi:lipoprotein-releasing system permease protein